MKNNNLELRADCRICASPSRATLAGVRSALKSSDLEIADATGFSVEEIEEHFAKHITASDTGDERLDAALSAADEVYLAALLSNDLRAAAQVISIKGRLVNDLAKRRKESAKRQNLLEKAVPGDMSTYPPELAAFVEAHISAILERVAEFEREIA
jgi:hypothetical protein